MWADCERRVSSFGPMSLWARSNPCKFCVHSRSCAVRITVRRLESEGDVPKISQVVLLYVLRTNLQGVVSEWYYLKTSRDVARQGLFFIFQPGGLSVSLPAGSRQAWECKVGLSRLFPQLADADKILSQNFPWCSTLLLHKYLQVASKRQPPSKVFFKQP